MILGLGIDIVEISRVNSILDKHNSSFIKRILSDEEKNKLKNKSNINEFCAGRWAVKEAFAKALGTGIGAKCKMNEISCVNDDSGKPMILLYGDTLQTFNQLGAKNIFVSISHEKNYACANVIIEA